MHKIRLGGDHQTLIFSVMQFVDAMQPGGAKVNKSQSKLKNSPILLNLSFK